MEDIGITCLSEVRSREEVNGEGREGEKRQKIEEDQVISSSPKHEGEGEGGGGLLDNLLAKLSSPTSRAAPSHTIDGHDLEAANGDTKDGVNDDDGTAAGGGVINNIISSIFHRGGGGSDEGENGKHGGEQGKIEEENKVEGSEMGDKDLAQQNGGTKINGGSFISNLIPDDVAPASDEASILIHSVVHD